MNPNLQLLLPIKNCGLYSSILPELSKNWVQSKSVSVSTPMYLTIVIAAWMGHNHLNCTICRKVCTVEVIVATLHSKNLSVSSFFFIEHCENRRVVRMDI